MKTISILIVGVGGQGTLLTSRVLGKLAVDAGYQAKVSEVHGMAQRGGSVVTYVRFGDQVASPLIEPGQADVILAFEKLEALRWAGYVKPNGNVLVNDQEIPPMPVIMGNAAYPAGIEEKIAQKGGRLTKVDARSVALKCGNERAFNVVMLGLLARKLDLPKQLWLDAIAACVPPKTVAVNQQAFEAGYTL